MEYKFVARIFEINQQDLEDINALLPQLSERVRALNFRALNAVLEHGYFLVARDTRIVGVATLVPVFIPMVMSGRIEDVVVDRNWRGRDIGKTLIKHLLEKARELDMHHVDLTSNPRRAEANRLYPALGFELFATNNYRYTL